MTDINHDINTTQAASDSLHITGSRRGQHPNSRANLQPWKPGQSGNPKGRTTFGATYREWVAEFAREDDSGAPKYSMAALREIANADDDAPVSAPKRLAAVDMLEALEGGQQRHAAANRLFDRSEGKPGQSIAISADAAPQVTFNAPSPAEYIGDDERATLPESDNQDSQDNT